jgi:hypothetical protein
MTIRFVAGLNNVEPSAAIYGSGRWARTEENGRLQRTRPISRRPNHNPRNFVNGDICEWLRPGGLEL